MGGAGSRLEPRRRQQRALRGLVEEEDVRADEERAGERDAHPPAAAERLGRAVLHLGVEGEAGQDHRGAGLRAGRVDLLQPAGVGLGDAGEVGLTGRRDVSAAASIAPIVDSLEPGRRRGVVLPSCDEEARWPADQALVCLAALVPTGSGPSPHLPGAPSPRGAALCAPCRTPGRTPARTSRRPPPPAPHAGSALHGSVRAQRGGPQRLTSLSLSRSARCARLPAGEAPPPRAWTLRGIPSICFAAKARRNVLFPVPLRPMSP